MAASCSTCVRIEDVEQRLSCAGRMDRLGEPDPFQADVGQLCQHAAPVVVAALAGDPAATNQRVEASGEAARRQPCQVGELVHPAAVLGCLAEVDQHLVLGQGHVAVPHQIRIEAREHPSVGQQEQPPSPLFVVGQSVAPHTKIILCTSSGSGDDGSGPTRPSRRICCG